MDDLDLLARVRADVPPADALTLRRARRRLLERAVGPQVRRLRLRRRIVLRLSVAAGVAVALAGAGVVLGSPGEPRYGIGATVAAAEVLNRAADSALRQPPAAAAPRRDQYLYRREVGGQSAGTTGDQPASDAAHLCRSVHETWQPVDADRRTVIRRTDGIVLRQGNGDPTRYPHDPLCEYGSFTADVGTARDDSYGGPAALGRLPTDPRALYDHFRREAADASLVDDETLTRLLDLGRTGSPFLGPQLTAAILRAVAYVPGIEHLGTGTDLLGRPGTVVGRTEAGRGTRREIVFDLAIGRMLGERQTLVRPDVAFGGPSCAPGTPCPGATGSPSTLRPGAVLWQSVITTAVVDRVGQRPAR